MLSNLLQKKKSGHFWHNLPLNSSRPCFYNFSLKKIQREAGIPAIRFLHASTAALIRFSFSYPAFSYGQGLSFQKFCPVFSLSERNIFVDIKEFTFGIIFILTPLNKL